MTCCRYSSLPRSVDGSVCDGAPYDEFPAKGCMVRCVLTSLRFKVAKLTEQTTRGCETQGETQDEERVLVCLRSLSLVIVRD